MSEFFNDLINIAAQRFEFALDYWYITVPILIVFLTIIVMAGRKRTG